MGFDITKIREPIEVYQAAFGNPEALARRIRSGVTMYHWELQALACLIEGRLKPPKIDRRKRRPEYLWNFSQIEEDMKLPNAEFLYELCMGTLKEQGSKYRRSEEVMQCVAKHDNIDIDTLRNYISRSAFEKPNLPRAPVGVVEQYHAWLLRTGKMTI